MSDYLFTSKRLGFRNWLEKDKIPFFRINSDKHVMAHFPNTLTSQESDQLWERLHQHYHENQFTYFAVDELESGLLIGFIGIKHQNYDYQHTPFIDIGWRLSPTFWGKGYATEGARTCLQFGFNTIGLDKIFSVAVSSNKSSFRVMEKIGMHKIDTFIHPGMDENHPLQPCDCFIIENPTKKQS